MSSCSQIGCKILGKYCISVLSIGFKRKALLTLIRVPIKVHVFPWLPHGFRRLDGFKYAFLGLVSHNVDRGAFLIRSSELIDLL